MTTTVWAHDALEATRAALLPAADQQRAVAMAAYMKHRAPFLGIASPERRRLTRDGLASLGRPTPDDALAFARLCWGEPEREFHYAGLDALARVERQLEPGALGDLHWLATTKPWWDTVDLLAGHPIGSIVRRYPSERALMDCWLTSDDLWLRRTALLHQLHAGDDTDEKWLFAACADRSHETDFFIRKAIGWALRSHAHCGPAQADAVRRFIAEHDEHLSGLSKREALNRVRH